MKAGSSILNPYAESYVPLSKRGAPDGNKDFKSLGDGPKGPNETVTVVPRGWDPIVQAPQSFNIHNADAFYSAENSKLKGHAVLEFHHSSSYSPVEMTEKAIPDEEFDMDLAYLQMMFPGVSEQSLSDVYFANKCDLEATIDMLSHLEYSVDSSEKLPDTLDIGDVPESRGDANELSSQKLKNLNIEAGPSSSGVSGSTPVI